MLENGRRSNNIINYVNKNMGKFSNLIKSICKKHNIQFRKVDPRRSENIVLGINCNLLKEQKKILVSYMDYGRTAYSLRHVRAHTNLQELMQMIRVLIDMDFCIDVCACNNEDVTLEMPYDYYDYIIGFGDMFRLAKNRNPKAYSIMYMTENPYTISEERERERIEYFYKRTGKKIDYSRTGKFYLKNDELLADAIICLGEKKYYSNQLVQRVYPSAFKNSKYVKNSMEKRVSSNFLVFGVKGFVHKGNDLLVEVFRKHPEWKLYMCGGEIEKECRNYGIQLPSNVINCGFVDVESDKFLELVEKCVFVLLPSCSEGMSTSVLTCMRHGMIPVTMRGTGMDELAYYCEFFEDFQICTIEQKLESLRFVDSRELEKYSDRIYMYANDIFTLEMYTEGIKKAFNVIFENGGHHAF